MNFIKLTQTTGNSCYVNKSTIIAVVDINAPPTTPYTLVHLSNGKTIGVKETPDEVLRMITRDK